MAKTRGSPRVPPSEFFALIQMGQSVWWIDQARRQIEDLLPKRTAVLLKNGVSIQALAQAFVAMHYMKEQIEALTSAFNATFEPWKLEIFPEQLEAAGLTNVPLAKGYRVGVSSRFYAGIQKGKKDEALDWLRANGLGDLIQETVNSQTLSAAFKERVEQQNLDVPEDIFSTHPVLSTSVTATPPKKGT